jgi:hypothetical protein
MKFDFSTSSGTYQIERSGSNLTPLGGLVAFASFVNELGVLDLLENNFPVQRLSNNALPVRDVLVGFFLTTLLDGHRFSDIRFIQNDPVVGEAFGVHKRIPGDDTVRRLFERVAPEDGRKLMYAVSQYLYKSLPDRYILDWDSTVTTRYGNQEGVEIGYNPTKPGRGSHHPLVCSVGGVRLCLDIELRSGKSHTAGGWIECMERLFENLPTGKLPWLNRADIGFCGEEFLKWHEESVDRPHYLFKLRKTKLVRAAIDSISEERWQGSASINALQLAECKLRLSGWDRERRVVLGRRLISKQSPEESGTLFGMCEYRYYAYVTDLSEGQFNCWQISDLYDKRADCENLFDELKNQWGLAGFCSQKQNVTEFAARMTLFAYNLWSLFVRFFNIGTHEEARTSRREFMLLPAKMVKSGRQKQIGISVADLSWERIKTGYERLLQWVHSNAPQLNLGATVGNVAIAFFGQSNQELLCYDG